MIAAVRGRVRGSEGNELVITLGSIDLTVLVPAATAGRLAPGADVELSTHLAIRPDHVALYGFESPAALVAFELLLSVSGVGPKGALGLLSALDVDELRRAIIEGNSRALARAPGVGLRVAARIVAELQEKFAALPATATDGRAAEIGAALDALVALGYSLPDASRAIQAQMGGGSAEDLVRAALEFLDERSR